MNEPARVRFDLLRFPAVRWLLARPVFPLALQVAVLVALLLLVVNGWGLGDGYTGAELKTLRKTNLTTLSVWGLWWPVMIALAIVAGRVWCTICPMELVARVTHRLGRRVSPGAKLPRVLRLGWLALAAYLVLQVAVAALALHRVPQLTAVMLLCMLGSAGLAGAIFRHPRAFCVALCPAGPLLSVYSRFTPFQLDRRDDPTCAGCTTRDCVSAATRDRLDGRGCPSLVRPFRRQPADGCVLCLQCAKTCPHDNMGLGLVAPSSALRRPSLLGPMETAFVMIASGFVTHEVVGEVKWLDAWFHVAPEALADVLPVLSSRSWEGLWYLLLYPAVIWGLVALVMLAFGKRGGLGTALRAVATGAAPVVALGPSGQGPGQAGELGWVPAPVPGGSPRCLDLRGAGRSDPRDAWPAGGPVGGGWGDPAGPGLAHPAALASWGRLERAGERAVRALRYGVGAGVVQPGARDLGPGAVSPACPQVWRSKGGALMVAPGSVRHRKRSPRQGRGRAGGVG